MSDTPLKSPKEIAAGIVGRAKDMAHLYDLILESIQAERDRAKELVEALEYASCEGMDDADMYAEGDKCIEAVISIANHARKALEKYRSGG